MQNMYRVKRNGYPHFHHYIYHILDIVKITNMAQVLSKFHRHIII